MEKTSDKIKNVNIEYFWGSVNDHKKDSQSYIFEYIYDRKKGRKMKTGCIRAYAVELENEESVIFISHSKANINFDKYDPCIEQTIIFNRMMHMYDFVCGNAPFRTKIKDPNSVFKWNKLYNRMEERARKYFKQCSRVVRYIDCFRYVDANNDM